MLPGIRCGFRGIITDMFSCNELLIASVIIIVVIFVFIFRNIDSLFPLITTWYVTTITSTLRSFRVINIPASLSAKPITRTIRLNIIFAFLFAHK
mgnify:FL=1